MKQYYGPVAQSKSGERFFVNSRNAGVLAYEGSWPQSTTDRDTFNYLYDYLASSSGEMHVGYGRGPGVASKW